MMNVLPFQGGVNRARKTISIDQLLAWSYRDMRAQSSRGLYEQEAEADGYEWHGRSCDGVAAMMEIGRVGCRIQGGGSFAKVSEIGDHDIVDEHVRSLLSRFEQALVITNAMTGSAPDWKPAARHRLAPVDWMTLEADKPGWNAKAGEHMAKVEYTDSRPAWPYCPVWEIDKPEMVELFRGQYTRWAGCLALIHEVLAAGDVLRKHVLSDELPHPEPWTQPEIVEKVVALRSREAVDAEGGLRVS